MKEYFKQGSFNLEIKKAFEQAKNNPILDSRLVALEKEIVELGKIKNEQAFRREDEIEQEILAHSLVVDDVMAFKEALFEVAKLCGQDKDWVIDMLAHENAHANMAQVAQYKVIKFIVLFIKDESGKLVSIQPACYFRSDPNFSKIESITKRIAITDAPRLYDNKPSPRDESELIKDQAELDALARNSLDKSEILRIRRDLGLL